MSETLSPVIKEATVARFGGNGEVYVYDPFRKTDEEVTLDWEDLYINNYKNLRPGVTKILVKMASEADGLLTIVPKEDEEDEYH